MPRKTLFSALLLLTALPAAFAVACSSSSGSGDKGGDGGGSGSSSGGNCDTGGGGGDTCTPGQTPAYTSCANLTTPTVSYAKDIQPLFNTSCGIAGSTCHGNPSNDGKTNGQVYLGLPDGGTDAAQVLGVIVNQQSPENPGMVLVKPNDPKNSYLMHKLDDDQCQFASACNATNNPVFANCGLGMPYSSGILSTELRDTIRRWIAQGAENN